MFRQRLSLKMPNARIHDVLSDLYELCQITSHKDERVVFLVFHTGVRILRHHR